jgi:cyclophilin family peptidyl-prolyl cis-trans isomerase
LPKEYRVRRFLFLVLALTALPGCSSSGPNPRVAMETSMGTIKIELFQDKAPITVKNFLDYVDDKFYDGTIFHRVMANFMIQGGGMTPDLGEKKTRPAIRNESANGLRNERGTLAMARTDEADSASAQFFINVKDNDGLDRARAPDGVGYAVFGRVLEGMEVVDNIRDVKTGTRAVKMGPRQVVGEMKDVPVEVVLIKSIRRLETPKQAK